MQGKQTRLTIAGETHTLREWGKISGTPWRTIKSRLGKGFTDSAAVFGEKFTRSHEEVRVEKRLAPVAFPVTVYNRWGGVQSISWRAA